jgi:hypothetical protein
VCCIAMGLIHSRGIIFSINGTNVAT